MKILVVDDQKTNVVLLSAILNKFGECDTASNGKEAVELCKKNINGSYYDVIFLDIMMPVMDGHLALKRIRQIEDLKVMASNQESIRSIIVMATGLGDNEKEIMSFCSNADASITKPFSKAQVIALLEKLDLI